MSSTFLKAQTFRKFGFRLCRHIVYVNRPSVDNSATSNQSTADSRTLFTACPENRPKMGGPVETVTINAEDDSIRCATNTRGVLGNCIQYRLNIRRRAGNDSQDFARRSLLLQRLL